MNIDSPATRDYHEIALTHSRRDRSDPFTYRRIYSSLVNGSSKIPDYAQTESPYLEEVEVGGRTISAPRIRYTSVALPWGT